MLQIISLKTNNRINPLGIDSKQPYFTWVLKSDKKQTYQKTYQITITEFDKTIVWDSGQIDSEQSVQVKYKGSDLKPSTKYFIDLRVSDNNEENAHISGSFETGLLSYKNFSAKWISHDLSPDDSACPIFFRSFHTQGKVKSARVYVSSLGIYKLEINSKKVSDVFFAPGWTNYKKRIMYQTYDITELIEAENTIDMTVARGWYAGYIGFHYSQENYGSKVAAILQLRLEYEDGSVEIISTDNNWQYKTGIIRNSEIYHGERIDLTYKSELAKPVILLDYPYNVLTAQENEPVRINKKIPAQKLIKTPAGETVIDFGQNMSGVIEAKLCQLAGVEVVISHAEVLDQFGNFYTENLRAARAQDTFVCSGGCDIFRPEFTYHGFRYIKIEGLDSEPDIQDFTACALYSDIEETGSFSCSHAGINKLQQNIQWGIRSNFLDVPTDCPQRDERLGWTGDAQVIAATATFNYDTKLFFRKWLNDLASEQTLDKGVPHVIPNILQEGDDAAGWIEGAAAWGDAATIIPWTLYRTYGDIETLRSQYPSMKNWVEFIRARAGDKNLWQTGFQFGDWLALDKEEAVSNTGATDVYFVASAFYALSTNLLMQSARILGYYEDEAEYASLYKEILKSFRSEYITENGRLVSETQTGCILALRFALADTEHNEVITRSLVDNIRRHNNHLATGFVGTPYLCHVLSENGYHELAGKIILQEDYPSWLYAVNMGATTVWERWNSMLPDRSIEDTGMNSFNHYAYGAIGDWLYQKLCGLNIIEPGYKRSKIMPMPISGINHANASINTVYGKLSCAWSKNDRKYSVDIEIPTNTTAIVRLPGRDDEIELGSGLYRYVYFA